MIDWNKPLCYGKYGKYGFESGEVKVELLGSATYGNAVKLTYDDGSSAIYLVNDSGQDRGGIQWVMNKPQEPQVISFWCNVWRSPNNGKLAWGLHSFDTKEAALSAAGSSKNLVDTVEFRYTEKL